MIRAIIFDKDGVLLNLEQTWLDSAIAMTYFVSDLTAGKHDASVFQKIIGIDENSRRIDPDGMFAAGTSKAQIDAIIAFEPELEPELRENSETRKKLRDVFLNTRETTLGKFGSVANGDVITPLTALKDAGYKMGVLTNDAEASARRGCADIGISQLMDEVIGFDSGFGHKPEPHGFLELCARFQITPEEAVMVGDTAADRDAAQAAGAGHFVGISASEYTPRALMGCRHILPDLTGLPALIKKLSA